MTVKVGFLGAGFIARYHAMQLALASEPNEVVAVHDLDPQRAEKFVAEVGGNVVDGIDEVIDACDAVFVCTWTAAHLAEVERLSSAGVPLFCEKPLSTDLDSAARLAAAVRTAGVPNVVGLVLRSSPALLAVREMINDPSVGQVMNVVFRDDQYLPTQGMYGSTWRGDRDKAGSGVLLEHSIHDMDLLEWLFGRIDTVMALESHLHDLLGIEDSVGVLVRFASGATASLVTVWHDVLSRPSQRRIEVFCQRALITLEGDIFGPVRREDSAEELVLEGDDLASWLEARGVPLVSAEQQFLVAVREQLEGREPPSLSPGVDEALRAHVLVDATYRSAHLGGAPVTVPAPG